MSEWWSYRPSDFLMFSARTWGRLIEHWNEALWPWQLLLLAVGAVLLAMAVRAPGSMRAVIVVVLAALWAWVAWAFHWERFAEINTGARWFAVAFVGEAVLLLALGLRSAPRTPLPALRAAGLALAAAALFLYPLFAPLTGSGWTQSEVAGVMPDPTALFTVGLLLALPLRQRGVLLVFPLLTLAVGWTTAWLLRAG